MKRFLTIITFSIILVTFLSGCSDTVDNEFTFKNFATNKVFVNFRAKSIEVKAGDTVVLSNIDKGKYLYETTFEVPASAINSKAEGAVSGDVTLSAGTKILIIYSSTFVDDTYILSATISTSEAISSGDDDPLSP